MATAGYSGTALIKKLGIKPEMKVLIINKPDDYYKLLEVDITEDVIRNYALKNDLVDVKVCAVSNIWSGLKLVVPVAKRK